MENSKKIAELVKVDDAGNFKVRYEGEAEFRPVELDKELAAALIFGILTR